MTKGTIIRDNSKVEWLYLVIRIMRSTFDSFLVV